MTATLVERRAAVPFVLPDAELDPVLCVGVSHRTAPISLRERLALSPAAIAAALSRFGCGRTERPSGISELVIVSTCNRLELYAAAGEGGEERLFELIAESTGVESTELRRAIYVMRGEDAVRHLCRTAAGLESMIQGEPQILGQLNAAYSSALSQGAAGHTLSTLFRGALKAGRRVRSDTGINRNPATVGSAAVKLVSETVADLSSAQVLVIGAGETAELTLSALQHRGARDVLVANRTAEQADRVVSRFGGGRIPFERIGQALELADVVISSTAAPHHVLTRKMVAEAMSVRPERPMIIVDLAVPRDVDPEAATIAGVTYADLDDLQQHVSRTLAERSMELPRVNGILDEEVAICVEALQQLAVQPLIADLRSRTDAVRREALARAARHFAHLPEADRVRIEAFSESLVNRIFHDPITRLREESRKGEGAGYAIALRELFGLSE